MSKALHVTPKTVAFDIVLTGIVWILFTLWFRDHVPSEDAAIILGVAAFSAVPAAGTFWFCLQMFKVVLRHQRLLKAGQADQ